MPETPTDPGPGPGLPIVTAVLGWVRRELDAFVALPAVTAAADKIASLVLSTYRSMVACAGDQQVTELPADLERTTIVSGLSEPTDFRFLPDGRIIVIEKSGSVKIFDQNPGSQPVVAAVLPTKTNGEQGLVGIELDPDFAENGYVYMAYTTLDSYDRLSRFTLHDDSIDLSSESVLMQSAELAGPMHHGGEIYFGPDGKLYWATGDNSESTNAQDLSNIHGKILRLNPDGTAPEDNPFVNIPGAIPQIYAYGLRNPFRFTFTPDGQILAGDVGNAAWEELNLITAGANYGWPSTEGACDGCGFVNPVYVYPHTPAPAEAGSITSVLVYTGDALPAEYQNKVFIADFAIGWIKELTLSSDYSSFISERTIDSAAGTTVKLAQGPDGNIYQLTIYPGELSRISASGGNRAPTAVITATPGSGLAPLTVNFSSAGSNDLDPGSTLSYSWDFDDGTSSAEANPVKTYTANGSYGVTLTVSDGEKTGTATQTIVVGSTPPTVEIDAPLDESHYNAGDTITFHGTADDAEDGTLPSDALNWTIVFHHNEHIHPFEDNIVGAGGSVTLPTNDHNIATTWYEITLTATDSSGLSTSKSVQIYPNLVTLTFNSSNPAATYTIDGIPHQGTYTETAVVGVVRVLSAPTTQTVSGKTLVFSGWSDGLDQTHQITTPAGNITYTVYFDEAGNAVIAM